MSVQINSGNPKRASFSFLEPMIYLSLGFGKLMAISRLDTARARYLTATPSDLLVQGMIRDGPLPHLGFRQL
jgi:hypothetical protein